MTRTRLLVLGWLGVTAMIILGDHFFHVRTEILDYHWGPIVDGQSAWVWLVFALASAAFVISAALWPLRDVPARFPWAGLVDAAAIFVLAYALSGQVGESHPTLFFWALVVAWLVRVATRGADAPAYLVYGVGLAAAGVVGEGLVSMVGLFDYDLQQVVDCPWWLTGLYLHGSVALLELSRGARSIAARA